MGMPSVALRARIYELTKGCAVHMPRCHATCNKGERFKTAKSRVGRVVERLWCHFDNVIVAIAAANNAHIIVEFGRRQSSVV
jgi:hypothetical protein